MGMSLLDYLTEFKTLDSYLGNCDANGDDVDIDICKMLMSITYEKIFYYEGKNIDKEDPYFPAECVDFMLRARSEKVSA